MDQRRKALVSDLLRVVEEHAENEDIDELSKYAFFKFQVACSEAELSKGIHKTKASSKKHSYFTISQILGIDIIGFWNLIGIITIATIIYGMKFDYYDPIKVVTDFGNKKCLFSGDEFLSEMVRPPVNCDMCKDLHSIPIEFNLTRETFLTEYAYSAKPVLIKNAISGWKALDHFNLSFFKNLYDSKSDAYDIQNQNAQFFPYKTEFATLKEGLHISEERQKSAWYFGWSNADEEIAKKLRTYYERPSFLPLDAESSKVDWMFMGMSSKGAPIHIDYVGRPSWQAQVKGIKTWTLVPSPECSSVCSTLNVTVYPGDIINVDTNRWYHATFIHPGDISCTIGSEYD